MPEATTVIRDNQEPATDGENAPTTSRRSCCAATLLLSGSSTSQNRNVSGITKLPDSILRFSIGRYLPNPSRAMMAAALSREACFNSDKLDFGEIDEEFASKLTDDDLADILLSIDAVNTLKMLKLIGCVDISGVGLEPLRGSSVLQQIDLSTSDQASSMATNEDFFAPNYPWCFALSEDAIVPILDSIISKHDKSLKHVQFPLFWRNNKRGLLTEFMERYNLVQNNRTCACTKCRDGFQASEEYPWMNHTNKSSKYWGLQKYTCYECLMHVCYECETPFCKSCEKMFCGDCCSTRYCDSCGMASCSNCDDLLKCDECEERFCSDCGDVRTCECCNQTRCFECALHYTCESCGTMSNCVECAHVDNVQWCDFCEEGHCNDCRLKVYKEGNLDCKGCRSLLLPRIMQEKDSLCEQLVAIENGTNVHLSEANIEFVMERAFCTKDDAIKALKEISGSYGHLNDAVALLILKPKSNDKLCIFGKDQM